MFKKLFALASMTALTGAVISVSAAGCSSTTETTTSDAAVDSGPKKDATALDADEEEEDAGMCPEDIGFTVADLDKEVGFKPPAAATTACTPTELTQIEKNFDSAKTWFDVAKDVSAGCKACVTTKDTDANWGPIVGTAADNGNTGFINWGACFADIAGAACGKATQYAEFCINSACNDCATTDATRRNCQQKAASGTCGDFVDSVQSGCAGDAGASATEKCGTLANAIAHLCGGGVDGGS